MLGCLSLVTFLFKSNVCVTQKGVKVSRPKPTQVKHLSADPLYIRLAGLNTNIRLGWKTPSGTNTGVLWTFVYYG